MDILMSDTLWNLVLISLTFSIFLMALVQKIKKSKFFHYKWQIWLINFCCAFLMGIPFSMTFFEQDLTSAIWISLFGFIGAPSLYEALKKQNIIAYKPESSGCTNKSENMVSIPKENEIKREEMK